MPLASIWCLYYNFWIYFTPWPSVSIVNFEQVNDDCGVSSNKRFIKKDWKKISEGGVFWRCVIWGRQLSTIYRNKDWSFHNDSTKQAGPRMWYWRNTLHKSDEVSSSILSGESGIRFDKNGFEEWVLSPHSAEILLQPDRFKIGRCLLSCWYISDYA